jgi:hypothetical protein
VGTNNAAFPNASDTNIYYSFLYKFNDTSIIPATGAKIFLVNRANSGINSGVVTGPHWEMHAMNVGGGQVQLGIFKPAGAATNYATTNISSGQTFFVVIRQHIIPGANNDVDEIWINPPTNSFGVGEGSVPPSAASASDGAEDQSGSTGPGRFWIGAGFDSQFDEFRVGTTWADVTPLVGSCDVAGITTSPSSFTQTAELNTTLSVVAAGTSPTYQWQLSTNSGTTWANIAGATGAIFTTPVLQLTDNGNQYRVIANVACNGSSATSAVATATITAPVVTPVGTVTDDIFTRIDRSIEPVNDTNTVWFTAGTPADNLITSVSLTPLGYMQGSPASGTSLLWLGYFTETNTPPVHLALGRAIRSTLRFKPTGFVSHTNNAGLRFGMFDYADGGVRITADGAAVSGSQGNGVGVRGYMFNLDFGPNFSVNSPLQLLVRNNLGDNNLMGTTGDYLSLGSGPAGGGFSNAPAFTGGTEYTLVFTVARIADNSVTVTAAISGGGTNWTHSVTETNFAYRRFDSFAIRPNSLETSADLFNFSEFKVEVVAVSIAPASISLGTISRSGNNVTLNWTPTPAGSFTYTVQRKTNLLDATWTTLVTGLSAPTYTDTTASGDKGFYRVSSP